MMLNGRTRVLTHALICALGASALVLGCGDDDTGKKADAGPDGGADAGSTKGSASWTMMGYDSNNNYFQPNEKTLNVGNAKDLVEQWRFTVAGFPPGSPVVADGKVFALATGGMYAIDLASGEQVWSQPDVAGTASPAYADGAVYLHATGGKLFKLNAADGSIVWGPIATYPDQPRCDGTSSPILAGRKVLVGHSCGVPEVTGGDDQKVVRGGVEAFDINDGSPLWTYWTIPEAGENGAMVWSTVTVDLQAKVVFAATGNNYTVVGDNSDAIHAIDLETGERKWIQQVRKADLWSLSGGITSTGTDTDFGANPILATVDGRKIVADGDKGSSFWALDRETGEILWNHEALSATHHPAYGGVLNNGAFDGKYFYVAANEAPKTVDGVMQYAAHLHVLDPKDGADVIEPVTLGAAVWGAPSLANGVLFVPVNSVLHVYNAKTGEELTSFDTGGTIVAGAAAIVDGKVIVKSGLQYMFAQDAMNNNQVICYGLGDPKNIKKDAGTVGEPTFTGVYKDIVVGMGCSGSPLCHSGDIGHLQMKDKRTTYAALVDVKAMGQNLEAGIGPDCKDSGLTRVVPGKPDESLLVKKLEGTQSCGTSMPPGLKLSADQIAQVRTWIANGAKDD
jgi:polyvinyl alcohol dehydrogenase (cytochrome)